jgi:organic radical activating enzyme
MTIGKKMTVDRLIAIKPMYEPYVNITWQVNDFCNFKCTYCNPGNWAGLGKKYDSPSDYLKILHNMEKIISHYEKKGTKGYKFFFSGGEPTVWDNLIPLILWLKERIDDPHIAINTNLSRSTNWWKDHYHLFHDVVASFHIDFANRDRYLTTLEFLQDKVNYLCSRMMMQENRFDEVVEFGELVKSKLKNYNLEWVPLFKTISTDVEPWDYSDPKMHEFFKTHTFESKTTIHKPEGSKWQCASKEVYSSGNEMPLNGNRIVAERRNFFSGWLCNVDESLFINSAGITTAASCGQGPDLGNIYDDIQLLSKPVLCRKLQCTCGTDIIITKQISNVR